MATHGRYPAAIAAALAIGMATGSPAAAAGWEMRDFETPLGDRGVALLVQAKRQPAVHLGIGCDGDTGTRWRGVAVIEEPDSKVGLGMSGDVRIRFGEIAARDLWSVRTTATERRVWTAPESTKLARRLLSEEAKSPDAQVTIEIHGIGGKPVPLTFPLVGLAEKIDKLIARCDDWDLKVKE
jgi:hypothetical protein